MSKEEKAGSWEQGWGHLSPLCRLLDAKSAYRSSCLSHRKDRGILSWSIKDWHRSLLREYTGAKLVCVHRKSLYLEGSSAVFRQQPPWKGKSLLKQLGTQLSKSQKAEGEKACLPHSRLCVIFPAELCVFTLISRRQELLLQGLQPNTQFS